MKKVNVDYGDTRDNLFYVKEALDFIVKVDESDAGGCSFAGSAYATVAKQGLLHCNQAIERLEKAAGVGVSNG